MIHRSKAPAAFILLPSLLLIGGCASDDGNQNYRELERDQDLFQVEPAAALEEPVLIPEAETEPLQPVAEAGLVIEREAEPSLDGVRREEWPLLVVEPVDAGIDHGPTYFGRDDRLSDDVDVLGAGTLEERLNLALDSSTAQGLTGASFGRTFTEPLQFAADLILLPVNLVLQPPFTSARNAQ